ncbi:TPA: hypothetical protein PXM28_003664 [Yersinia enterocolitica]|nr:hypothetical protein [Yersinia enterocolitica]
MANTCPALSLVNDVLSDATPGTMGWIIAVFTVASTVMALTTRATKTGG